MQVIMPQIGMTMIEGLITKWMKKDGEMVQKGEILFVVETEKLENEIEATASGVLKILVPEGESVKCGEPIAELN